MTDITNLTKVIGLRGAKASVEAFSGTLEEQMVAIATDTGQIGLYTNGAWLWTPSFNDSEGDPADVSSGDALDGTSIYAARRDHVHHGEITGGGHAHGLARWNGASGQTTFELPDLAEYLESVIASGAEEDPAGVSISADRTQIIFDTALASAKTVLAHYVIAVM